MNSLPSPSSGQWTVYVIDILSFFLQSQVAGPPARPPSPRPVSPHFVKPRRLTAHGLHTKCRPSQSFPPVRGAHRSAARGVMLARRTSRRDYALRWSRLAELSVDRNETPVSSRIGRLTKSRELIKLHIEDMTAVGKPPRRSKAATLDTLRRELGPSRSRHWIASG